MAIYSLGKNVFVHELNEIFRGFRTIVTSFGGQSRSSEYRKDQMHLIFTTGPCSSNNSVSSAVLRREIQ